jgi:hypothetical protein
VKSNPPTVKLAKMKTQLDLDLDKSLKERQKLLLWYENGSKTFT